MIHDATPEPPSVSNQKALKRDFGEIAICSGLLFAVWFYNFHISHDPHFAVMYTPPLLVGLGFAVLKTFFRDAYPPRLLEGSKQLKRLKQWRLAFFLSAGLFLVAAFVSDAARMELFGHPAYICVCVAITLAAYIKIRTSSGS